jgi:hypothetical protein
VLEDSKSDVSWGNQIRSYVLDQSRIKDLRTNVEIGNTGAVLDGDLDPFLEASLKQGLWQRDEREDRRDRPDPASQPRSSNKLIAERRAKLDRLRERAGRSRTIPARLDAERAARRATAIERRMVRRAPVRVEVAGRMMFKRVMGKASFAKTSRTAPG